MTNAQSVEIIKIEAFERSGKGKSYTRKLRRQGKIPGVILEKSSSQLIELDPKLLPKAWKAGKSFSLVMKGKETPVHIQELQVDPVSRQALHVDLMFAR